MKKIYKKGIAFLSIFTICALIAGCGCGKKNSEDDASNKVMEITITPEPTPTRAPEQVSADAVVQNGKYIMVNEYLAQKKDKSAADIPDLADTEGKEDGGGEE